MIKVKQYSSEDRQIWNDFIDSSKNGIFMFKREFMEYHADRFKDFSLLFYEEDELIALLPLSIKNQEVISHGGLTYGGFITSESMKQYKMNECFDSLLAYLRDNNIKKIIYKPIPHIFHKYPAQEDLYALFKSGGKIFKIEPSSTILLQNPLKMPKGRKAQISRAKREGVTIEESTDFDTFINLENEILSKYHNTKAVHNAEELKLLKSRFEKEIQLWIAKYQGQIIAATLLFVYDKVVHTQYMAANDKAREIGGLDYLIKTLIDKFKESKVYFDFGISTEDNGEILNEGLISQKEGFGARTISYHTWEIDL